MIHYMGCEINCCCPVKMSPPVDMGFEWSMPGMVRPGFGGTRRPLLYGITASDSRRNGHIDNHTTNGFTEGCNTMIKKLKRISYDLRNVEVYWRKMPLGFVPSRSYFQII